MKPTIRKLKDIRGRRIVGYNARFALAEGNGPDPSTATARCEEALHAAMSRLDRATLIGRWRDHVYVVFPTLHGWSYWIDTFTHADYTIACGLSDREGAQDSAMHHLAQNLWTLDVESDDAFIEGLSTKVREQLRSWILFQRSYARLKAEGKTDAEAHRLASRG